MPEPLITTVAEDRAQGGGKGLKTGAIGLVGSVVVATASTAPAYSLAATLGFIVVGGTAFVGTQAPAVILLAFVPMYLIAQAYKELNAVDPDCGTTFTWTTRAFGPIAGWMGGWAIVIADIIVMANLAYIAGQYSFVFLGGFGLPGVAALAGNVWASTIVGVLWIALMTWICWRGIEISARLQYGLLGFEMVLLIAFAVIALVRVGTGQGEAGSIPFDWSWFNPFTVDFASALMPALLVAIFIYWGWDSAVAVNEETKDPSRTPGRAAILSTLLLVATYLLVTIATVSFAGVGEQGLGLANPDNSGDVFSAIAPAVFGGGPIGQVMQVLFAATILTSAAASTQTTILPTARTSLSMAVHKAMPAVFGRIHPRYLTPTWSTLGMGAASILFFLLFTLISQNLLNALVESLGVMIAFYYGITGLACAWFFRRTLTSSVRNLFLRGILPAAGGLILFVILAYGLVQYASPDWLVDDAGDPVTIFGLGATAVVGVLGLLVGFLGIAAYRTRGRDFFRGRIIPTAAYVEGEAVRDEHRVVD